MRSFSDAAPSSTFKPRVNFSLSVVGNKGGRPKNEDDPPKYPEVIAVASQHGRPDDGSDASPFSNVELFAPLKPFNEWPAGMTKDKLT